MTVEATDTGEMPFEAAIAALRANKAAQQTPAPESTTPEASVPEAKPAEPVRVEGSPGSAQPPAQAVAPTEAPGDQSKPPESAPIDPALKGLLDREARLQAREKELNKLEAAQKKFKYNPVAAIRDIAPDASLAEIADALWVEELGDLAPPDAKKSKEVRGIRSEVEEIRASVEEERRRLAEEHSRQQGELAMNQYTGAIKSTVGSVDASKHPLVSGFHKKHSDGVVDELLSIARQHAQTTGEVPAPEKLIDSLEAYLQRYQVATDSAPAPVVTQVVTPPAPAQTLRNQHQQVQPNLQPADELDDDYLREQALKAVREDRKRRGLG